MTRVNTGISIDEQVLADVDAILAAMAEEDEYGAAPDRSRVIEKKLIEWVEDNGEYLDDDGAEADTGNWIASLAAD